MNKFVVYFDSFMIDLSLSVIYQLMLHDDVSIPTLLHNGFIESAWTEWAEACGG